MENLKNVAPIEDFNWDAYENGESVTNASHEELEKAYDGTLNKVNDREVVDGTVIAMNKREVVVNIGYKSDGIIPLNEFRYNPDLKIGDTVEVEYDDKDKEYTATVEVEFEKEDADFVYVIDKKMNPTSLTVDVKYSFATIMKNAALNTLMGLGTVFVILAFLIFLISLFKFVPGSGAQQVKKKKEETPAPAPVPVAVPVQEEADDSELIAVIAAAIAASEGTTTDGFVVRSIRKINRKKR